MVRHGKNAYNMDKVAKFYIGWDRNMIQFDGDCHRSIGGIVFASSDEAEEAMDKILDGLEQGKNIIILGVKPLSLVMWI